MLKQVAEMSLEQTAAALAVGSGTMIGGVLCLVLVGGCCVCVVGGSSLLCCGTEPNIPDVGPLPLRTMSKNFAGLFVTPTSSSDKSMEEGKPTEASGLDNKTETPASEASEAKASEAETPEAEVPATKLSM